MRKLSIKNIIEFKRKSDRGKHKFATDIKLNIEKTNTESGGDYWISCLSAISNSYKFNDLHFIKDKIYELQERLKSSDYDRTKTMYQRNIDILYSFEDNDFNKWRPSKKITFIKKHNPDSVITIKGLQVQATPHHVLTYQKNGVKEIGAIWFIAKLGGYKKAELGMFADILYRYLKTNFSKDYDLNPNYCIAVDVVNNFDVSYSQIQEAEISALLITTIDEIKKIMYPGLD